MEIKSEQQYETVMVTDVDIAFPGDRREYVLWPGKDKYELTADTLTIHRGGGTIQHHLRHAHYVAINQRPMRVVVPAVGAVTAPETPKAAPHE